MDNLPALRNINFNTCSHVIYVNDSSQFHNNVVYIVVSGDQRLQAYAICSDASVP